MSTAMLTKIVRLCVMLVVVAAGSAASAQVSRTGELQQLANDFGFQINMLRDFDRRAAEERTRALAVVLDRWNSSTRTDADYQKMKSWLEGAIQATMPGSQDPLPQLPWFEARLASAPELPLPNEPNADEPGTDPQTERAQLPEPTHTAAESPDATSDVTPEIPAAQPQREAVTSFWDRHPGARPLEIKDPFEDDEPLAATSATPRVAMRPTGFSTAGDSTSDVGINTAELGARVRGFVHGLRGIEARLVASPDMSLEELLGVVRELRQLSSQRDFVGMYLDVVSLDNPDQAPDLPSTNHAKALVKDRLKRLRQTDSDHAAAINSLETMLLGL